ncbi:hypothetical protein VNO77_49998 [Canavalia gladiata]|uniref:Uncharacterized protein n=1 Tax=Canavalia gladiata TaxID=3824 RepID=A0AAN9JE52_CANGL
MEVKETWAFSIFTQGNLTTREQICDLRRLLPVVSSRHSAMRTGIPPDVNLASVSDLESSTFLFDLLPANPHRFKGLRSSSIHKDSICPLFEKNRSTPSVLLRMNASGALEGDKILLWGLRAFPFLGPFGLLLVSTRTSFRSLCFLFDSGSEKHGFRVSIKSIRHPFLLDEGSFPQASSLPISHYGRYSMRECGCELIP